MNLSMDFHNDKNSGELIRAIDQGHSLTSLLDFACFRLPPMFLDLFVAFVYVYTLFDVYMSFILVVAGFAYIWTGAKTTAWSVKRRRQYNTTMRYEGKGKLLKFSSRKRYTTTWFMRQKTHEW